MQPLKHNPVFPRNRSQQATSVQPPFISGTELGTGAPHIVPESFFSIGGTYEGAPGSGKTYSLISDLQQRILASLHMPRSFLYVDLKADIGSSEVFHGLRVAAEHVGIPFKWCVIGDTHFGRPSSAFNPMAMEFWRQSDLDTQANFLCSSFGLEYGVDYGPHFFSSLISYLAEYTRKRFPNACTFRQLHRAVSELISLSPKKRPRDIHRDYIEKAIVFHSVLTRLSRYDVLNIAPDSGHPLDVADLRIDCADLFRTPQVVYIFVNKAIGGTAAAEAGRLPIFALQYSSQLCQRLIPVTLAVDEVQVIASHTLKDGLNQLRGMDVGLIYAFQSRENLVTSAVDLRPNVKNLAVDRTFTCTDEDEQLRFSKASGHTSALRATMSGQPTMGGMFAVKNFSLREELEPFHSLNTVKAVSANPELSFVTIKRDAPDCRYNGMPVIVRRIPRDDLRQYASMPWPQDVAGTFVPATVVPEVDPDEIDLAGPVQPIHIRRAGNQIGWKGVGDVGN